jgi:hypothetical protein
LFKTPPKGPTRGFENFTQEENAMNFEEKKNILIFPSSGFSYLILLFFSFSRALLDEKGPHSGHVVKTSCEQGRAAAAC